MPLIKSAGTKAFGKNVKREMATGKPQKQAVAIAYSVKRKAGGDFQPQGNDTDAYDPLSSEVEDDNDSVPERPPHGTSTASRSGWKRGDNQI